MRQRSTAFDSLRHDPRLRCILCESLLPTSVATASSEPMPDSICLRCWALTPDERRVLRDQAMARVLRRDHTR